MKSLFFCVWLITLVLSQAEIDPMADEIVEEPLIADPEPEVTAQNNPPINARKFEFNKETAYLYRYELVAVTAIFFYLIMYRTGRSQNSHIIEQFYRQTRAYIQDNFAHIGFTKNSGEDPFVAESASDAMFYASGRQNVDYLEIAFNMKKRQDLLYSLVYEAIYPEKDLITIDVPVKADHPIVLAIINRKKVAKTVENNLDIAKLAGSFEVKELPHTFEVLGEASESVDYIVDGHVCRKISELATLVQSIHYTDQKMFSEQSGHLRAIFYASKKNQAKYLQGLELVFYLVDRIHNMKVSANLKSKALKAREAFNATKEKEKLEKHKEDMRKKKEDKKRQEEAWLRSLPPEKQKREDEKRKKKELNKLLKSKTMKVA